MSKEIMSENKEIMTVSIVKNSCAKKKIDYSQYCDIDQYGVGKNLRQLDLIEYIIKNEYIIAVNGQYPYIYENGVYKQDFNGVKIMQVIQSYLPRNLVDSQRVKRLFNLLVFQKKVAVDEKELNNCKDTIINFENCMLDVETMKVYKHDPRRYITNQVAVKYNPNAKEPKKFNEFLKKNCENQQGAEELIKAYIGYSFTRSLAFKKCLMIYGCRDSGKSVLLKIIDFIIGEENVSNIMLQDIHDRFNTIGTKDKLVNIYADIDSKTLDASGVFKMLIGGDKIKAESKGKNIIYFRPHCKQIYSCNEIPKIVGDKSDATIRKFSFVSWNYVPTKEERNVRLFEELKEEKEGIALECVKAVHRAFKNNALVETEYSKQKQADIQIASDPLEAFINELCVKGSEKRFKRSEFTKMYNGYCSINKHTPLKKTAVPNAMECKGFKCSKSNGEYYFYGLSMIDEPSKDDKELHELYMECVTLSSHIENKTKK